MPCSLILNVRSSLGYYTLIAHYTDFPGRWGGLTSLFLTEVNSPVSEGLGNASDFNQSGLSSQDGSFFYLFDLQIGTRHLLDIDEDVTDTYLYTAFGEEALAMGSTYNPLRFGGRFGYYSDTNNQLFVRRNVLDTTIGNWLTKDRLWSLSPQFSAYVYVGNNPVDRIDPSGLSYVGQCPPGFIPYGGNTCIASLYYPELPGACFWRRYSELSGMGKSDVGSCIIAKTQCRSTINCDPPPARPKPPSSPQPTNPQPPTAPSPKLKCEIPDDPGDCPGGREGCLRAIGRDNLEGIIECVVTTTSGCRALYPTDPVQQFECFEATYTLCQDIQDPYSIQALFAVYNCFRNCKER